MGLGASWGAPRLAWPRWRGLPHAHARAGRYLRLRECERAGARIFEPAVLGRPRKFVAAQMQESAALAWAGAWRGIMREHIVSARARELVQDAVHARACVHAGARICARARAHTRSFKVAAALLLAGGLAGRQGGCRVWGASRLARPRRRKLARMASIVHARSRACVLRSPATRLHPLERAGPTWRGCS